MNPAARSTPAELSADQPAPIPLRFEVRRGTRLAARPSVSVIALVTDDVTCLERCLDSIGECTSDEVSHEVVVVANGTAPDAVAELTRREEITVVRSPVNLGFAGGCNLAARFAGGRRLAFLNDDASVTSGWLEGLHRALDSDERIGVVGSKVLLRDGRLQEAGSVLWSDGSTSGVGRGDDPHAEAYQQRRAVDYVSFCSAMVRRAAWDAVGGFDERYFPAYYEDADLCLSLQERGWAVMYEPTSVILHQEGGSASRNFRDFISRRNQRLFVAKWGELLSRYRQAPTDAARSKAVDEALRLSSARLASNRQPSSTDITTAPSDVSAPPTDRDTVTMVVEALRADCLVKSEYIRLLEERAARRTVTDVLRSRVRSRLRSRGGRA